MLLCVGVCVWEGGACPYKFFIKTFIYHITIIIFLLFVDIRRYHVIIEMCQCEHSYELIDDTVFDVQCLKMEMEKQSSHIIIMIISKSYVRTMNTSTACIKLYFLETSFNLLSKWMFRIESSGKVSISHSYNDYININTIHAEQKPFSSHLFFSLIEWIHIWPNGWKIFQLPVYINIYFCVNICVPYVSFSISALFFEYNWYFSMEENKKHMCIMWISHSCNDINLWWTQTNFLIKMHDRSDSRCQCVFCFVTTYI